MFLHTTLDRIAAAWKRSSFGQRASKHLPAVRRYRPRLNALEHRTLLTVFSATSVSSLAADILKANTNGALSNTINLVPSSSSSAWTVTSVNNFTNGANGLPVIYGGGPLTINGNGVELTTSHWNNGVDARFFNIGSGQKVTINNLDLAFGYQNDGGAIYNSGNLTLNYVDVGDNLAVGPNVNTTAAGGAIYQVPAGITAPSLTLGAGSVVEYNFAL